MTSRRKKNAVPILPIDNSAKPRKRSHADKHCLHTCRRIRCKFYKGSRKLNGRGGAFNSHIENTNLHSACNDQCPGFKFLLFPPPRQETPPEGLRILYVFPVDFVIPCKETIVDSMSYVREHYDEEDEGDCEWLSVMRKRIEGFELGIWIDGSAKLMYTWDWVKMLYYIVGDTGEDERPSNIGHRAGCLMTHDMFKKELYSQEGRRRLAEDHDIIIVSILTDEHDPDQPNFDREAQFREWCCWMMSLRDLELSVPIWPSILEQERFQNKTAVEKDLDRIASKLGTIRPTRLDPQVDNIPNNQEWVAKRTSSDSSRHVCEYSTDMELPDSGIGRWFVQQKVPTLLSAGEIRAIFAGWKTKQTNGTIRSWITTPVGGELGTERWETNELNHIAPLRSYKVGNIDDWSLSNTMISSQEVDDEGSKGFHRFLKRTLKLLIASEKSLHGYPLSLEYIVRLDVGIMPHPGATKGLEACYFVNEVTRAPDMTLWEYREGGAERLERLWVPVECALLEMVKWHREH